MVNLLKLYSKKDVDMVEVRKYCGIENNMHAWIFQGYDFVVRGENGNATSLLAEDGVCYTYLPKIEDKKDLNYGRYDHSGVEFDDVRIVSAPESMNLVRSTVVSVNGLKSLIDNNPGLSFLHYKKEEKGKVKTIGTR